MVFSIRNIIYFVTYIYKKNLLYFYDARKLSKIFDPLIEYW